MTLPLNRNRTNIHSDHTGCSSAQVGSWVQTKWGKQGIQTQAGTDQLDWVPFHLSGESQIRSTSSRLSINEWSGAQLCLQARDGRMSHSPRSPVWPWSLASNFLFSSRIFQLPHFLQIGGGVHKPTLLSLHFPILAWFPGLYPLAANPGHLHILAYYFITAETSYHACGQCQNWEGWWRGQCGSTVSLDVHVISAHKPGLELESALITL